MKMIWLLLLLCPAGLLGQPESYAGRIAVHRMKYKQAFLAEARSPLDSQGVEHLLFFAADSSYRVSAKFERRTGAEPFEMATYSGKTQPYIAYGTLTFDLQDTTLTLTVYRNRLFLPFKDKTNGTHTYGGGRYLDFSSKDIENGALILDFNLAYNPYCAYRDGYNCPVPPSENHLPLPVMAGEQDYAVPKGDR